jgi:hypothetical protein
MYGPGTEPVQGFGANERGSLPVMSTWAWRFDLAVSAPSVLAMAAERA